MSDEDFNEGKKLIRKRSSILEKAKEIKLQESLEQVHPIYQECSYATFKPASYVESEIIANLFFQKLLYFNSYFSLEVGIILILSFIYKVRDCYAL